ncbi:MAG TPA: hypothetical protein VFP68_12345, partial [Burkholderiaceae bacterium]|nr:hypothetical protein [Burkholderiaceae bacterium]
SSNRFRKQLVGTASAPPARRLGFLHSPETAVHELTRRRATCSARTLRGQVRICHCPTIPHTLARMALWTALWTLSALWTALWTLSAFWTALWTLSAFWTALWTLSAFWTALWTLSAQVKIRGCEIFRSLQICLMTCCWSLG